MTAATKPQALPIQFENIPSQLRERRQWVAWRYVWKDGKNDQPGKWTKVPVNPHTGANASTTDSTTWGTFDEARTAIDRFGGDGIGFVFTADDHFCGIDLDDCFEADGYTLKPWARAVVDAVPAFWERSVSGKGLHGIGFEYDDLPPSRRSGPVEYYRDGRFFTTSGHVFEDNGILLRGDAEFFNWYERQFSQPAAQQARMPPPANVMPVDDIEVVERCQRFRNGGKFADLMTGSTAHHGGDSSAADAALLESILWANGGDIDQAVRIACTSMLWREKWESKRGDTDYIHYTAERILAKMTSFYDPQRNQPVMPTVPFGTVQPAPVSGGSAAIDSTVETSTVSNDQTVCITATELARFRALEAEAAKVPALEARVSELEGLQSRDKAIGRNTGLGATRTSAATVVHFLASRETMPDGPADGMHQITIEAKVVDDDGQEKIVGFAPDVGVRRAAASHHLDQFAEHGLIRQETRPVPVIRNGVTVMERRRFIGRPIGVTNAIAHADLFIGADLETNHGGKREPRLCPHCETDLDVTGTKTITTTVCLDCGGIVDEKETTQKPSERTQNTSNDKMFQDGASGAVSGDDPDDRMYQDGAYKDVTTTMDEKERRMYQDGASGFGLGPPPPLTLLKPLAPERPQWQ